MPHRIFFSWQSDMPNRIGRGLIENCLQKAIKTIAADAELNPAHRTLRLDRDTLNTPGTPPVMETIFDKIANAAVFVADMTYVAKRGRNRRAPNPNVLIEYGWALRALSWRRIILVMNTAAGDPERYELPFDLRHMRRPMLFKCAPQTQPAGRKAVRDELTKQLTAALKAIFEDEAALAEMRPKAPDEPHPHDVELLREIHRLLSQNVRDFLHQHDFGGPFPRVRLSPVYEIADWVGAAYEFHDRLLQAGWADLRSAIDGFAKLALERLHASDRNPHMASPLTDMDRAGGVSPQTYAVIKALNVQATALSEAIDTFDRLARDRVRVAIGEVAAEEVKPDPRTAQVEAALQEMAFDPHRGAFPEVVSRPRMTLRLLPFAAAEGRRLDPAQVKALQAKFPFQRDARVRSDGDARQWWTCAQPVRRGELPNPETSWRLRVVRPGNFEYQATIGHRIDDDEEIVIDGRKLEAKAVHHLERLAGFAGELGFDGQALISITFEGMEDVVLMRPGPGGRRMRVPDLGYAPILLRNFHQSVADSLREIFDMLWQSGGWPEGSTSYVDGAWAGYRDEENYAWLV